jgi:hypothetical protein
MLASSSYCKEARQKKILQDEVAQVSPSSTIPNLRIDWKISACNVMHDNVAPHLAGAWCLPPTAIDEQLGRYDGIRGRYWIWGRVDAPWIWACNVPAFQNLSTRLRTLGCDLVPCLFLGPRAGATVLCQKLRQSCWTDRECCAVTRATPPAPRRGSR